MEIDALRPGDSMLVTWVNEIRHLGGCAAYAVFDNFYEATCARYFAIDCVRLTGVVEIFRSLRQSSDLPRASFIVNALEQYTFHWCSLSTEDSCKRFRAGQATSHGTYS